MAQSVSGSGAETLEAVQPPRRARVGGRRERRRRVVYVVGCMVVVLVDSRMGEIGRLGGGGMWTRWSV